MSSARREDSFWGGGPLFELEERIRQRRPHWSQLEYAVAFVLLTWAPPIILSALEGHEHAAAFLRNTSNHYRLLLAGPLAILVEPVVGHVLRRAAHQFVASGVIDAEQTARFQDVLCRVRRLRDSPTAEVLLLGATFLFTASLALHVAPSAPTQPLERFARTSPAWLWYTWLSRPLLHFLLLRWLWQIAMWAIFLRQTARLSLRLSAAHPDHAGGLGFLAQAHASFGLVAFPFAIVWAAGWRELFLSGVSSADSLKVSLPIFVAVILTVLVGPLVVFTPKLIVARQRAMLEYGTLGSEYCRLFEHRWLRADAHPEESLLGTADLQSFADLQNTVAAVRAARFLPFDRSMVIALGLGTALPLVPLLTLIWPIRDLVRYALKPFL